MIYATAVVKPRRENNIMRKMDRYYNTNKLHIEEFQLLSKLLLNEAEQNILCNSLKDYEQKHKVDILVQELQVLLKTPEKFRLMKILRNLIPPAHHHEFDRLVTGNTRLKSRKKWSHNRRGIRQIYDGNLDKDCRRRDIRVLVINRYPLDETLGFSIRGGAEFGLGIYVSEVDPGSVAEMSGLEVGDKIMECNEICLENATNGQAVHALTNENRSKLVIHRTNKVPEWKLAKQKTLWYSMEEKSIATGDIDELDKVLSEEGLGKEFPERRIVLATSKKNNIIGMNIRGGLEYGLGIYISRVDSSGIAFKKGVLPGDQIMNVNGVSFDNIMHNYAVNILRNQSPLIMTVRHVARFPVYKEVTEEYTWSDGHVQLPFIHLPYADLDIGGVIEEQFTDTCIDESDGSMRHHPSESGIDLISYHSENPIEYQEKYMNKSADVYKRKYYSEGAQSDDELETSRRMESWVKGVDKKTVNPEYASDSELEGPETRLRGRYGSEINEDFAIEIFSDLERKYSEGVLQKNKSQSIGKDNIAVEKQPVHLKSLDVDDDVDSLCEEQTMSFFVSDGRDRDDYNSKLQKKSIKETSKVHKKKPKHYATVQEITPAQSTPLADRTYMDVSSPEFRSRPDDPTNSASSSELYKKLGMTETQKMDYLVERAKSLEINKSHLQSQLAAEKYDSEHIGQPVGTISISQHDNMKEEEYDERYEIKGKLVTTLYSPELQERIRDLEYRKSNLGLRELDALTSTPVTIGLDKNDGKSSTRKKKWKTVKERFMGSLRNKTPRLLSQLSNSSEVDKYSMSLLEDAAKIYLVEDEYHAVMRHIQNYHETRDLDWLIEVLLAILDRPEKILLLKEIRGVIFQSNQIRFDQIVNRYQEDAYEKMTMKVHLPLNRDQNKEPKKMLMTTEMGEESHFHIKTIDQADREMKKQKEVLNLFKDWNSKSDPPSDNPISAYSNPNSMKDYMFGDRDVVISELAVESQRKLGGGMTMAYVSKNKDFLGMRVSGGIDFDEQPEVIVDWVTPGGAASDEGNVRPGMIILAVDDCDLSHATHGEAVTALKTSFSNKRNVTMKMVLKDPTYL